MSDENRVFEADSLHKTFRTGFLRKKIRAVRSLSFAVTEGQIYGILGPNGAGKTTTIKVAMGLIHATSGSVRLFGKNSREPESRSFVGYLPENPYFHEYLTPMELLSFHGRLAGLSRTEIKSRVNELIELVDLNQARKRPLRKFSKGMLQRIGLAQAMISKPKLLVLDEPMSGLDPIGRRFVTDLILSLNREGTTVLFSSHILSDVERLCHKVVIMNKGVKVAEGEIEDLLRKEADTETLEELFVRKALAI